MTRLRLFGYSLFELCLVLSISAILVIVALPAFQDFAQQEKTQTTVYQLVNLLNYARLSAIKLHTAVTFCASLDHETCNPNWLGDFMVFIDETAAGKVANKKDLLRIWQVPLEQGTFRWQAKQNYLIMQPTGINPGNAGKFYYCPVDHNLDYARAIVINFVGRIAITDQQTESKLHCDH
ncbi:MAG: ral secretion pathway protein GspH [Gammaproteobacteria bacterium]|jgi:type IV fimbrial biogenesis protein FimT|nr:ral secretion pathway protein GspH [Gammaproteobacteria bacterium]